MSNVIPNINIKEDLYVDAENRRLRSLLQQQEQRLQLALKVNRLGCYDWYPKEGQASWDERMHEIFGKSATSTQDPNEYFLSVVHPEDIKKIKQNFIIYFAPDCKKVELEERYRIVIDGEVRYIKSNCYFLRNKDGDALRVIGTCADISREREMELQKIRTRQLEINNKALEQFAYVASHDLREPLRSLKGFAEIIQSKYAGQLDSKADKYLDFISLAASRMDNIVNGLLFYSRIGRDSQWTSVDCQEIMQEVSTYFEEVFSNNKIKLELESLPTIMGYRNELKMLFHHLVDNAIKYRKKDTTTVISISVKKELNGHTFCIADNGIGIDPTYYEKIFSLFQRLHARHEYEGTGVGLAHCKKIIDLHGGNIWVNSALNVGCSFYFTIPLS